MTDDQLAQALKRRDAAAADELYERFSAPLVRYFQVALPDASLAEDAAQEVFCRLIDAIVHDKVRQLRSMNALVFTIARRLAIDTGRSWSRRPRELPLDHPVNPHADNPGTLLDHLPDHSESARDTALRHEREQMLLELLRELDPETREIIVLRHIEDMSSRDVAAALGVAEGTVWSRLHRGMKVLRARIEQLERRSSQREPSRAEETTRKGGSRG